MQYSQISSPNAGKLGSITLTNPNHHSPGGKFEVSKGTPHIGQVNKSAGSREREVASTLTAPVMSNDYVAVLQPHLSAA